MYDQTVYFIYYDVIICSAQSYFVPEEYRIQFTVEIQEVTNPCSILVSFGAT